MSTPIIAPYSVPPQFTPIPAPKRLYFKAFAVGLVVGAALEFVLVKSNYYNVIRDSKVRELKREASKVEEEGL
jgi:hypothetical protein